MAHPDPNSMRSHDDNLQGKPLAWAEFDQAVTANPPRVDPRDRFTADRAYEGEPRDESITAQPPPPVIESPEGFERDESFNPDDLVTVATCLNVAEAELARLHLAEEDIQAFINDAETVAMDWLLANAIGNVKVQVAGRDVPAARRVLSRRTSSQNEDDNAPEQLSCLRCGAPMREADAKCAACGWSFAEGAAAAE